MGIKDEIQAKARQTKQKAQPRQDGASEQERLRQRADAAQPRLNGAGEQERLRQRAEEARRSGRRNVDDVEDELEPRR
ncbi:hypothetical protein [Embleya sp. NPDC020886]|uniref:hypothetical protein n=1 Tax=Embleya sp. NPDC020886 TaxID=3363980 RepID=UPI00379B82EF